LYLGGDGRYPWELWIPLGMVDIPGKQWISRGFFDHNAPKLYSSNMNLKGKC